MIEPLLRTVVDVDVQGYMLTLEEAKRDLGVFDTGDPTLDAETDAAVQDVLEAAHTWCEEACYRTFRVDAVRELQLSEWVNPVTFWDPPLISVDSVGYTDPNGNAETVSSVDYTVATPTKTQGRLVFHNDWNRPDIVTGRPNAIQIRYQSGYKTTQDIPPSAKQACRLMMSKFWDANRDVPVLSAYESSALALLDGLRWGGYE